MRDRCDDGRIAGVSIAADGEEAHAGAGKSGGEDAETEDQDVATDHGGPADHAGAAAEGWAERSGSAERSSSSEGWNSTDGWNSTER